MRVIRCFALLLFALALAGCSFFGQGRGDVDFVGTPGYDEATEELYFAAAFSPNGLRGDEVTIEYEILRGSTTITSGSAWAEAFDDELGSWVTGEVRVELAQSEYGGDTITIHLDPDEKLTSTWKIVDNRKKTVDIPN